MSKLEASENVNIILCKSLPGQGKKKMFFQSNEAFLLFFFPFYFFPK